MTAFIAPAVQAAVVAGLTAYLSGLPALDEVQVSDGFSGVDEASQERIFTGNARSVEVTPSGLRAGKTFYNETAEFDLIMQVLGPDSAPAVTKARVQELMGAASDYVMNNRTLGGSVPDLNWIVASSWNLTTMYGETGSIAEVTLTIKYNARLT